MLVFIDMLELILRNLAQSHYKILLLLDGLLSWSEWSLILWGFFGDIRILGENTLRFWSLFESITLALIL